MGCFTDLLHDLAVSLSIDQLYFSEDEQCSLLINENTEVTLQFNDSVGKLIMFSSPGYLHADVGVNLLSELLKANYFTLGTHGHTFSLSPGSGKLILFREYTDAQLQDVDSLNRALVCLASVTEVWKGIIEKTLDNTDTIQPRRLHKKNPVDLG